MQFNIGYQVWGFIALWCLRRNSLWKRNYVVNIFVTFILFIYLLWYLLFCDGQTETNTLKFKKWHMKRRQIWINNKINYLYFHIFVIYKIMCPHLILTRQYRESCEFLRGGTQAVETANVFFTLQRHMELLVRSSLLGESVVYWGGGAHTPRKIVTGL